MVCRTNLSFRDIILIVTVFNAKTNYFLPVVFDNTVLDVGVRALATNHCTVFHISVCELAATDVAANNIRVCQFALPDVTIATDITVDQLATVINVAVIIYVAVSLALLCW